MRTSMGEKIYIFVVLPDSGVGLFQDILTMMMVSSNRSITNHYRVSTNYRRRGELGSEESEDNFRDYHSFREVMKTST